MQKDDSWFRWRRPEEGQGYRINNRSGFFAAVAFVCLVTCCAIVPPILGRGSTLSFVVAVLLSIGTLIGLLYVVRRHSNWHG